MNIWKESIKVLFLSFEIFLFVSFFCDLLLNPTLRPSQFPTYIRNDEVKGVLGERGRGGGGKWRQSPEGEAQYLSVSTFTATTTA
jgi:hypothetical protein